MLTALCETLLYVLGSHKILFSTRRNFDRGGRREAQHVRDRSDVSHTGLTGGLTRRLIVAQLNHAINDSIQTGKLSDDGPSIFYHHVLERNDPFPDTPQLYL